MSSTYRARWRFIAVALVLISLGLGYLWLHLTTGFDNGRLQPGANAVATAGLHVAPLDAGPAGLQDGDVVVSAAGRPMEAWAADALQGRWQWPGPQVGETVAYEVVRGDELIPVSVTLDYYPLGAIFRQNWGTILFALAFLPIAVYVFLRRPALPAARVLLLLGAALFSATTWSLGLQVGDFITGVGLWLYLITIIGGFMLVWTASLHFSLVFPHPLPLLARRRWLLPLIYIMPYALLVVYIAALRVGATNTLDWLGGWPRFADLHAAVFLGLTLLTILWQFRHNVSRAARRQMRWLLLAAVIVGGAALFFYFLPPLLGSPGLDPNAIGLIGVLFPLAIAVAILRDNLFDIDSLLNRTLVYGGLSAIVAGIYVLVVGGLGLLFQARGNLLPALLATGLVAVLFQPLRERLQRAVNQLMYGERDEPFEALSRLGRRLETTLAPEFVYPTIVETVAQTLKLPYVALAVAPPHAPAGAADGGEAVVESYGRPLPDLERFDLTHQGLVVGHLLVAQRDPEEPFGDADRRLLRGIARQAGAAVQAVQLTADLQRSRRELVTAREEERRRLRRDLHDGLGPTLAGLNLQAGTLRRTIRRDPEAAEALVDEFRGDIRAAIEDIRRVVYALRPPALDQLGLVAALEREAAQYGRGEPGSRHALQVTVEAEPLPAMLPAAVEVAAYRIAQEALANVAHHAGARHAFVRLSLENRHALCLVVEDDGRGLTPAANGRGGRTGVGLVSMRERTEELGGIFTIENRPGGGTRIEAVLPLPEESL